MMKGLSQGFSVKDYFCSNFCKGKSAVLVRFSVLALLLLVCVGGASAETYSYNPFEANGVSEYFTSQLIGSLDNEPRMSAIQFSVDESIEIDNVTVDIGSTAGTSYQISSDVYIDEGKVDSTLQEGTLVKENWNPTFSTGEQTFDVSNIDLQSGQDYEIQFYTEDQQDGSLSIKVADVAPEDLKYGTNAFGSGFDPFYSDITFTGTLLNQPPEFNSTSISPDPPLIGENVSYGAEVFDSDGSVDYTNLSLSYGGSQVVSDEQRTGTTSPVWNDVFTPQDANKWLNATLEVVDDKGAVTTTEINRYLSNDAPQVSIQDPTNSTFWSYDVPLNVEVTDSDSNPGETFTCTVDKDGSQVDSFTIQEGVNTTYSSTVRTDLGSHAVDVSCTDPAGNTGTDTENYEVKALSEESVFASSPVFETENSSFQLDLETGSMVNSVDFELNYSGSVRDSESLSSSGIETLGSSLYHEAPLVSSNQTVKDWTIAYSANITDFSDSNTYSTLGGETGIQSQEILQAFYLENQSLDKSQYVAGDDITYTGTVVNETGKGSVSDTVENSQKNISVSLQQSRINDSKSLFEGVTATDIISQSSKNVDVDPDYTVDFNGQSRSLEASTLSTTLEQLEVGLCSDVNGEKALEFTTYDEKNRTQTVDSELNFAAEYWNPDTPSQKKVANFSSSGTANHEICVSPGYAEAKIDSTEKLIQYSDSGDQYVLRSYFLINETIDNSTTSIPLYMLEKSEAERVRFEVQDENRNPLSDVVVKVQRYFPSVDKQLTTAMVKTGAEGQTETFLEVNEIYYAFNLYRNGQLQKEVGQQVIPSDLSLVFTLGGDNPPNWYDYDDTVSHDCRYNATHVTCDYESTTEGLQNVSLTVQKDGVVSPVQVGQSFGSTASGSITVDGFNASKNRLTYKLAANFDNDVNNILEIQSLGDNNSVIGETGLMISLFMFLTMSFAGLWKPSASVVLGVFALIVSSFLPFLAVSQTALTALIALGAVLVWRMS